MYSLPYNFRFILHICNFSILSFVLYLLSINLLTFTKHLFNTLYVQGNRLWNQR